MASAETSLRSRHHLSSVGRSTQGRAASLVDVVSNPLRDRDARLAESLEKLVGDALLGEGLGLVEVRFRVCREDADGIVFICKIENPPRRDSDPGYPSWRWWSPLLTSAAGFQASLKDALDRRRERMVAERLAPRSAS